MLVFGKRSMRYTCHYVTKGLTVSQAASPLSFPDVMFFLMHRCRNLLWAHRPFIDANLVNQAGPEGPGFHGLAGTNI